MKNKVTILFLMLILAGSAKAQEQKVFWITLDGLRWQELFAGADSLFIANKQFVDDTTQLKVMFAGKTKEERRKKLLPFVWETVAHEGVLLGNRWKGSKVNLKNGMHFSYPGYNEILCGFADDEHINSNAKKDNPNKTLLEHLNKSEAFAGSVLVFGSWDVFPFIINEKRSGIPVNAGYRHALSKKPSERALFLNDIQDQTPRRWEGVRFDVFTHNYALEAIKEEKPKVVYIAYGETDDYAHDGRYDHYLKSAHQTDSFIKELWDFVQSDPFYKNQTTFVLTTDHGRGEGVNNDASKGVKDTWQHHGTDIKNADQTWVILFGNLAPKLGEYKKESQFYNAQLAKTIADMLNFSFDEPKADKAIRL